MNDMCDNWINKILSIRANIIVFNKYNTQRFVTLVSLNWYMQQGEKKTIHDNEWSISKCLK